VTAPSAMRFELPNAFTDGGHGCSIDVGVKRAYNLKCYRKP